MANYIQMTNLLPVALMGTAFALLDFFNSRQRKLDIEESLAKIQTNDGGNDDGI